MSIDGSKLSPWEQIYTFVATDGYNIHIHSPRLRAHLLATNHPVVIIPISRQLARDYIRDNVINPKRVLQLEGEALYEPIILCKTEAFGRPAAAIPEVLHVDGHHRLVRHALMGRSHIRAFLVEMRRWQPFRVYNLPNYATAADLAAEPIVPRSYWKSEHKP